MAAIRFFLLLVLLGGLTVLLVQNWTPVLPLVFLGGQTQALPLSIWILFSVAAGAITAIFIASCFQISSYFARPRARKQRRTAKTSARSATEEKNTYKTPDTTRTNSYTAATPPRQTPPRQTQSSVRDDSDDWETSPNGDWDFTEDTNPISQDTARREYSDRPVEDRRSNDFRDDDWEYTPQDPQTQPRVTVKNYTNSETKNENKAESKSSDRAASVYSYSAGEPKNSGVGRTESVYDAEYRVLTPPYKQNPSPPPPSDRPQNNNDDDDWGFINDEDWKVDGDDSPRPEK